MNKKTKLAFWQMYGILLITLLSNITIIMVASIVLMQDWLRVLLVVIALILMLLGLLIITSIDYNLGVYECKFCKHRFKPTLKAYIMGPHMFTSRKLKCPNCGKKSYCKRIYD